jgi:hypothetical protein
MLKRMEDELSQKRKELNEKQDAYWKESHEVSWDRTDRKRALEQIELRLGIPALKEEIKRLDQEVTEQTKKAWDLTD